MIRFHGDIRVPALRFGTTFQSVRHDFMRLTIRKVPIGATACSLLAAGVLSLYCVVPSDSVQKEFRFNRHAIDDTVAPFGSITLVFTAPVSDSSAVELVFSPTYYDYVLHFSAARDSVDLQLSGPLKGNTVYSIRLKNTVFSIDNDIFEPEYDSVSVVTCPVEQEPNNGIGVADTLRQRCFGTIAVVNDTDWYVVPENVGKLYLNSIGSQTTFALWIQGGGGVDSLHEYRMNDTLNVPATVKPPLLIAVYSYNRSVGGYYQIGCIAAGG
jgi:hypothetical protein